MLLLLVPNKVMRFNINSNQNIITFYDTFSPLVMCLAYGYVCVRVLPLICSWIVSNKRGPTRTINSLFLPPTLWLFLVKRLFLAFIQCYTKWLLQPIVFSFRGCPTVSTSLATTHVYRYCFAMKLLFYYSLFKRTLKTILHDLFAIIRCFSWDF